MERYKRLSKNKTKTYSNKEFVFIICMFLVLTEFYMEETQMENIND